MSPEQAKGRPVDKRSDVWAFGAVLFEMLTGRRAFEGEDVSETFAAILRGVPDWQALPDGTPSPIKRLLRRSLEKDVRSRLSDMAMVRAELREAQLPIPDDGVMAQRFPLSTWAVVAVSALLIGTAIVTWYWTSRMSSPAVDSRPVTRFSVELPDAMQLSSGGRTGIAISSDGTRIVFAANRQLYERTLDSSAAVAIPGTETTADGVVAASARTPFFSPDGQWIGYWHQGQLKRIPAGGGAAVRICDLPLAPEGAYWGADDRITYAEGVNGILRVNASGGTPETVIAFKNNERGSSPFTLGGSDWIVYVLHSETAAVDEGQVVAESPSRHERRVIVERVRDLRYAAPAYLVFGRGNGVWAQAFDAATVAPGGDAIQVLEGVSGVSGPGFAMHFAVSSSGTLAYVPGVVSTVASSSSLVKVTRSGQRTLLAEISGVSWYPRYSPDGNRVAFGISKTPALDEASDLWLLDVTRGARTRVTFSANNRFYPIWTADGTRLVFADGVGASNRVLWKTADGVSPPQVLIDSGLRRYPTSSAPDGKVIALYAGGTLNATRDLWMLHIGGDKPRLEMFMQTPFEERGAIFSPDGRWIAYVSNKSGQNDIYALPYPGPGSEVTISVGGGQEPVWGPSGRELFYRHDGKLLVVPVQPRGATLSIGAPKVMFADPYRPDTGGAGGGMANYDVARDGKSFVMVEEPRLPPAPVSTMRINVVLNWPEDLKTPSSRPPR
jgi:serine/threonine-protein kinase